MLRTLRLKNNYLVLINVFSHYFCIGFYYLKKNYLNPFFSNYILHRIAIRNKCRREIFADNGICTDVSLEIHNHCQITKSQNPFSFTQGVKQMSIA